MSDRVIRISYQPLTMFDHSNRWQLVSSCPEAQNIFKLKSRLTLNRYFLSYFHVVRCCRRGRWASASLAHLSFSLSCSLFLSLFCSQACTLVDRSITYLSCLRLAAAMQYSRMYFNGEIIPQGTNTKRENFPFAPSLPC